MTFTELLIYGAATWRIASIITQECGPFHIFINLREKVGIIHDEECVPIAWPDTFFGELLSCVWCSSIWVALFWGIMIFLSPALSLKIATIFAFSTVAVMINDRTSS